MNIKSLVIAAVAAVVLSSTANASFITFTDRAQWEIAVGGTFSEETFSSASTTGFTIEQIGSGHSTGISGGVYHDRTVLDTSYTNYHFNSLVNAFGANWDLRPGNAGQGLQLFAGGQLITPQIANTYNGGFFGLVSTTAFNLVSVHSGSYSGSAETHDVDNVVFASVSSVPEPESYALMLAGLGLMGAVARRRQAKQA
nr:PEP-CTERM sorting domain-containing protein [Rhodoferax sp.]